MSSRAKPQATRALFVYNLAVGLYLGYLRVRGSFAGLLLWSGCVLHVVLGLLLTRPAFGGFSAAKTDRTGQD
jgi:hypothetical protein